jgi:SpoVK/Ycf46/Vps4 family AAA+-type ATPase
LTEYRDTLEHLHDELRRLDMLLAGEVAAFRARLSAKGPGEFQGLFISHQEIDDLLKDAGQPHPQQAEARQAAGILGAEIRSRTAESLASGKLLRLPLLSNLYNLTAFETDLLILALAPELDLRYRKLYAYLQDDVSRKNPSIDLATRLFLQGRKERVQARAAFNPLATLFGSPLLTLYADPTDGPVPLPAWQFVIEPRIADFLLGSDRLDPRLLEPLSVASWGSAHVAIKDLLLPEPTRSALRRVAEQAVDGRGSVCLLHGPPGSGKKTCAAAVSTAIERSMLIVDLSACLSSGRPLSTLLNAALREAILYGSVLYLDHLEVIVDSAQDRIAVQDAVEEALSRFPGLAFLGSRQPWQPRNRFVQIIKLDLTMPNEHMRHRLWKFALASSQPEVESDIDTAYLAGAFRFSGGQIHRALKQAQKQAWLQRGALAALTMEDLLAGCREESTRHLVALAQKLPVNRGWDDLVLPRDTLAQLQEFCNQARHRLRVYDGWGFGQRLSLGKGLVGLFSGSSGTGKTLAVEVLSRDLGLDLYRVDLSSVVSKYIGETEKNLARVFHDAQEGNAILFFDEADALFGKRTEVKDAHDRYANIEVNFLLQQVEGYEGVIILASNMSKNIDPAFQRRLNFSIEFPFPDEDLRLRIWQGIFPRNAPLNSGLDYAFLANKFKISGGNIKNVAVSAAFHAASNGGVIGMDHIVLAMKREYQKLGKVCERSEFEQYYELVRE